MNSEDIHRLKIVAQSLCLRPNDYITIINMAASDVNGSREYLMALQMLKGKMLSLQSPLGVRSLAIIAAAMIYDSGPVTQQTGRILAIMLRRHIWTYLVSYRRLSDLEKTELRHVANSLRALDSI